MSLALIVDPSLEALIPPITTQEDAALRAQIIEAGRATESIKTYGGTIIDGHNRYRICTELGLPYDVCDMSASGELSSLADCKRWMLRNQFARRSLHEDQKLALCLVNSTDPPYFVPPGRMRDMQIAIDAGYGEQIIRGVYRLSGALKKIRDAARPNAAASPPVARAPRGPSVAPHIPEGHELSGVSTLTDEHGELSAQWNKTQKHGADTPPHPPVPEGHLIKRTSTMLRGDGTTAVQWISVEADKVAREQAMHDAWARHASLYAGLAAPVAAPNATDADTIMLYPLGDPHIGMLSWAPETGDHFDTRIACRELLQCVRLLVASAAPARQAIVTNLGDFMHAQDDNARTPSHGHQLDVDGRFAKVLDAGHVLMRGIVDACLARHELVAVRNLPGNHDPRVAAELSMWLRAVYENEPRVTVHDAFAAHQYDRFGSCLFGWHHGDRARPAELPALMASDRAADWGETTERVWHVGHVHHLTRNETPGCVVETHRTMAARDAYHAGRYRAGRSLCAIGYHREHGETSRATVGLSRVRAALLAKEVA